MLSHNLDLIQSHVHIRRSTYLRCKCQSSSKYIHSRVHQKVSLSREGFVEICRGDGYRPTLDLTRTYMVAAIAGTRPVLEMFWDASLGVLFWDVMYHVHVHQVSIRS